MIGLIFLPEKEIEGIRLFNEVPIGNVPFIVSELTIVVTSDNKPGLSEDLNTIAKIFLVEDSTVDESPF